MISGEPAIIGEVQLKIGAAFLSEGKLAERLGVSRPTVRKALAELEAAGVLAPVVKGAHAWWPAPPSSENQTFMEIAAEHWVAEECGS